MKEDNREEALRRLEEEFATPARSPEELVRRGGMLLRELRAFGDDLEDFGVRLEAHGERLEAFGIRLEAYCSRLEARGERLAQIEADLKALEAALVLELQSSEFD